MVNIVATVGTYLVSKFGKDLALTALYSANKIIVFSVFISIVTTLITFLFTIYESITDLFSLLTASSSGNLEGMSACGSVILGAFLENIGIYDAFNSLAPALMLAYLTYFNIILLGFSTGVYNFINKSITEFAQIVK